MKKDACEICLKNGAKKNVENSEIGPDSGNTEHERIHGCIAVVIAIYLVILFAEIVDFAPNHYFHTFAPPPLRNPGYAPEFE